MGIGTILIITDGAASSREGALAIVTELFGKKIYIRQGADFSAVDILGADLCFVGCASAGPEEFAYFSAVLRHINLSLRKCGVFSCNSQEAAAYLADLVLESGIKVEGEAMVSSDARALQGWARDIIQKIEGEEKENGTAES
jgi:hypothetical protein